MGAVPPDGEAVDDQRVGGDTEFKAVEIENAPAQVGGVKRFPTDVVNSLNGR